MKKLKYKLFMIRLSIHELIEKIHDWLFPYMVDPEEVKALKEYFQNEKK